MVRRDKPFTATTKNNNTPQQMITSYRRGNKWYTRQYMYVQRDDEGMPLRVLHYQFPGGILEYTDKLAVDLDQLPDALF